MKKKQKKGTIQLIITLVISIYLWVKVPSWEKMILDIIAKTPDAMNSFGSYWIKIVYFLIQHWEFISVIILFDSLYTIIYNKYLIDDIIKEIKRFKKAII